jgi:hypothetical protein
VTISGYELVHVLPKDPPPEGRWMETEPTWRYTFHREKTLHRALENELHRPGDYVAMRAAEIQTMLEEELEGTDRALLVVPVRRDNPTEIRTDRTYRVIKRPPSVIFWPEDGLE